MSDKLDRELRRRMKTRSRFTTLLVLYFCAALILPNCILANTEHYGWWSVEALILMPLGFYMMWSVALRRSGVMIWLAFPFIFFCAFQIVLLYLFGNSIIATDMFTNVLTTNPGEAGELLSNIYPSVLFVCALYVPLLWLAAREIAHRRYISRTTRLTTGLTGAALFALGTLALWPAYRASDTRHVLRDEVFPVNVIYNVGLCASEFRKTSRFERTSADFTYAAERTAEAPGREIYVYIIGEASRAMNWQLYGYERPTTPRLAELDDVVLFRDVLTQSNTTHKSVPLILSSVDTHEHEELYRRRGLPALFNEAGFETWFLSNQAPQGAMIDHLAHDARHVEYLGAPRFDEQLLDSMKRIVASCTAPKLLFILHCYGSATTSATRAVSPATCPTTTWPSRSRTSNASATPTTIRSSIPTTSSQRRSATCARLTGYARRCSTAPTTARICSTTSAGVFSTPRPRRPPTSSTWRPWRGSRRHTGSASPRRPRPPAATPTLRPPRTPFSTRWPAWPRSAATTSRARRRWSTRSTTAAHRAAT